MKMSTTAQERVSDSIIHQEVRKIPRSLMITPRLPYLTKNKNLKYKKVLDLKEKEIVCKPTKTWARVLENTLKEILSFKKIHNWKNSSELLLNVKQSFFIPAETWKLLGKMLTRNFHTLKTLELEFEGEALTSEGLEALSTSISRNLCNLKHLKLNFGRCTEITSEEVILFSYEISHLLELEAFETEFAALFCNKGSVFVNSSRRPWIPRQLVKLKALSLSFSAGNTSDIGLEALVSSVCRNQCQLKSLALHFYNEEITEKGLQTLSSQICSQLSNLQSFRFSFGSNNRITKEDFKAFVSILSEKLTDLRVLDMDFFFCDIDEQTVLTIGKTIIKHLQKLEDLSISCPNCQMTDEGLKLIFSDETSQLENLNRLALEFTNLSNISEKGVHNLLFTMNEKFPNLTNLKFGLGNSKLSDECLQVINQDLQTQFINLRVLDLLLWGCTNTTNEGIQNFVLGLYRHRNDLIKCVLNLKNSQGVTHQVEAKILEIFKSTNNFSLA